MLPSSVRKSLTASAIVATSVAAAAGLVPSAQAAPAGAANSPVTSTDGTSTVVVGGQAHTFGSKVSDAAWAPDGSRVAYVDDKGQIVTARPDGSWPFVAVPARAGVTVSGPAWIMDGTAIAFTETSGGSSTLKVVEAHTPSGQTATEGDAISMLGGAVFTEGTESAVDSNGKSIAFQHKAGAVDQVYIQDGFGRASAGPVLVGNGTEPTLSPDGTKVAYLVKDGSGDQQIWVAGWDKANDKPGAAPAQITTDAHDHLHPTWSPDGTRIAFEDAAPAGGAPIDIQSVDAAGANQRQESATPGVPAYQPLVKNKLERMFGGDRIATAIATSQASWQNAGGALGSTANSVVLSRYDQFADALGGATLATSTGGPLLLTQPDHLDAGVKTEISRVLGAPSASKTVYVLGGEQALSPAVYNTVHAMGYNVQRIAGPDRYSTSVEIAKAVVGTGNSPSEVLVATANNYPDALSAAAAAEVRSFGPPSGVVVLTNDKVVPASTAAYLAPLTHLQNKPTFYGIGGQGDAALTSVGIAHTKVAGADRYQTSALIARTFFTGFGGFSNAGSAPHAAGFATALSWPDALSGGAFMAMHGGPLLLVNPATGPSTDEAAWLSGWSGAIDTSYVFGGVNAVGDPAAAASAALVDGPAGQDYVVNPHA